MEGGGGWAGGGIAGRYYKNASFRGKPCFTRSDVRIDFTPGGEAPGGSLSTDPSFGAIKTNTNWSVKWDAQVIAKYTEKYTLKEMIAPGDSGIVYFGRRADGKNPAVMSGGGTRTATVSLIAGQTYNLEMTYVHRGASTWQARLRWSGNGPHPFAEEAIEPATPVGGNLPTPEPINSGWFGNGALAAFYNPAVGNACDNGYTGNLTIGKNTITNVAIVNGAYNLASLAVGQWIQARGLPAGTRITGLSNGNSTITLSHAATATGTGVSLSGNAPPPLDGKGQPMGDFFLQFVGGIAQVTHGLYTITFNGSAEVFSNGSDLHGQPGYPQEFLLAYNNGHNLGPVTIHGATYYNYGNDVPLSALQDVGGTGYNPATNTTTVLDYITTGWNNVAFKNTDRSGRGAPRGAPNRNGVRPVVGAPADNGITHLRIMAPTTRGGTADYPPGTVFNTAFLKVLAPYAVIRSNDTAWNLDQADADEYRDWSRRPLPSPFDFIANTNEKYQAAVPPPWEEEILMANEAGKDLYINLPPTASGMDPAYDPRYKQSYIYNLAKLLKNGDTVDGVKYPGLLPNLNVYIEYGNEIWNWTGGDVEGAHQNFQWAYTHKTADYQKFAAAAGHWANFASPGVVGNFNYQVWDVLRLKDISAIFRKVYGNSAMPSSTNGVPNADPRIRPVYEWQYGGGFNGGQGDSAVALAGIDREFSLNADYYLYGGGGGWYADDTDSSATSANALFKALPAKINKPGLSITANILSDARICQRFGLKDVGYEGGFDFSGLGAFGGGMTAAEQAAANDPRTARYVIETLDQFYRAGGSLPIVYEAIDDASDDDGWAVQTNIFAPPPPKLQGYLKAEKALPPAPLPPGWTAQTIGRPTGLNNGDACGAGTGGTWMIESQNPAGTGFATTNKHTADQYYTVSRPVAGNVTVTAELTSNPQGFGGAGLVMRLSNSDPGSPAVGLQTVSSNKQFMMGWRTGKGGPMLGWGAFSGNSILPPTTDGGKINPPVWLKLSEVGDVFTGSISKDNVKWIKVGSVTMSHANFPTASFAAGLVEDTNGGEGAYATFRHVKVVGGKRMAKRGGK